MIVDGSPGSRVKTRKAEFLFIPLAIPALIREIDRRRGGEKFEARVERSGHSARSADGTRIHYSQCGSGEKVIFFAHGWMCDSTVFRYQQEYFSQKYRVVSLDLRGHGLSGIPESLDYNPERLAEDLECVVDAVNPKEFVVGGHSMGGFTTFKFFERFGEEYAGRLKGLAIIDSTGTDLVEGLVMGDLVSRVYPRPLDLILRAIGRRNRISDPIIRVFAGTSAAYALVRWAAFGKRPDYDQVEQITTMLFSTPMTSVSLAAKACLDFHFDYYLPEVGLPVLVMVGDRDKLANLEVNTRTVEQLPDARLVIFEGAGHCAMMEQHEEFNSELEIFFDQVFSRTSGRSAGRKKSATGKGKGKEKSG